jgi:D-hydroxyproline dehydrogenase subunit gamma
MFARLPDLPGETVTVSIDGEPHTARVGDSVAAALLAAGRLAWRTSPVDGTPRGPFCMVGACQECLVEIDGRSNCQACLVTVAAGMRIVTRAAQGVVG